MILFSRMDIKSLRDQAKCPTVYSLGQFFEGLNFKSIKSTKLVELKYLEKTNYTVDLQAYFLLQLLYCVSMLLLTSSCKSAPAQYSKPLVIRSCSSVPLIIRNGIWIFLN